MLSAPGRVVFVVRGPAPSCGVVGRFSARGRRGLNRVRFTGRVGRRTLGPGAYRITAKTGTSRATRPVVVVIEPSATGRSFTCGQSATGGPEIFATLGEIFAGSGNAGNDPSAAVEIVARSPGAGDETGKSQDEAGSDSGVLPAVKDGLTGIPEALPALQIPSDSSPSSILGIGALLLLALSALALLLYILRFLRGPHAT